MEREQHALLFGRLQFAPLKITQSAAAHEVASMTSPAEEHFGFEIAALPSWPTNSMRASVASATVTDFSLDRKSPRFHMHHVAF